MRLLLKLHPFFIQSSLLISSFDVAAAAATSCSLFNSLVLCVFIYAKHLNKTTTNKCSVVDEQQNCDSESKSDDCLYLRMCAICCFCLLLRKQQQQTNVLDDFESHMISILQRLMCVFVSVYVYVYITRKRFLHTTGLAIAATTKNNKALDCDSDIEISTLKSIE